MIRSSVPGDSSTTLSDLQTLFECLADDILVLLPDVSPVEDCAAAQPKVDDLPMIYFPRLLELKNFKEDFFGRGLGQTRLEVSMKRLRIPKSSAGVASWRSVLCDERSTEKTLPESEMKEVSIACILAEYCETPFSLFTDIPESGNLFVVLNPPMSQKKSSSAILVELHYCWDSKEVTLSRFQTIPVGTRVAYLADRRRAF